MKKTPISLILCSAVILSACGNEDSFIDPIPTSSITVTSSSTTAPINDADNADVSFDTITTTTSSTSASAPSETSVTSSEASSETSAVTTTTTASVVTTTTPTETVTTTTTSNKTEFKTVSKTVYTKNYARFYSQASESSKVNCFIPPDSALAVSAVSADGAWYSVTYNSIKGFVRSALMTDTKPQTTTTTARTSTTTTTTVKNTSTTSTTTKAQDMSVSSKEREAELAIISLTNQLRTSSGLKTLTEDPKLSQAAKQRAKEIAALFDHARPDGRDVFTIFTEYGCVYGYKGENIAKAYASGKALHSGADFFEQWKNSSGHRKNMLTSNFTSIGVGVYYVINSDGSFYAYGVQLFGG